MCWRAGLVGADWECAAGKGSFTKVVTSSRNLEKSFRQKTQYVMLGSPLAGATSWKTAGRISLDAGGNCMLQLTTRPGPAIVICVVPCPVARRRQDEVAWVAGDGWFRGGMQRWLFSCDRVHRRAFV